MDLRRTVEVIALRLYEEKGIRLECEECFYLTDPKCPGVPHICALEGALENPDERNWVMKNLPERIEMRRKITRERTEK